MTFENIVAKGEIAHLLWPHCFYLYLTIKLSFLEIFQVFVTLFSKLCAADLLYVGKGLPIFKVLFVLTQKPAVRKEYLVHCYDH